MIDINIIEIFKKNKFLFFISFIFFSITPYFLINYQEQKSKEVNLSTIKIFEAYENTININYIIEKLKVYNRILTANATSKSWSFISNSPISFFDNRENVSERFSEIQIAKTKEYEVDIINPGKIDITFGSTNTENEMNNF